MGKNEAREGKGGKEAYLGKKQLRGEMKEGRKVEALELTDGEEGVTVEVNGERREDSWEEWRNEGG